eukprot:1041061-Amphidinium_carterae.1
MTHPEHTRERIGALMCKHPEISAIHRRCPGSQQSKQASHSSHTHEPGDCRFRNDHDMVDRLWRHPGVR